MLHNEHLTAGANLVKFLHDFSRLLNLQLLEIRKEMQSTTESVLKLIREMNCPGGDCHKFQTEMMGTLSNEDVLSQRLTHVIAAIGHLHKALERVFQDPDGQMKSAEVTFLCNNLLHQVTKDYTMQSEKKCFSQIFGDITSKRAA